MLYKNGCLGDSVVGLAYSLAIPDFIRASHGLVDYVEVPFELLRHNPGVFDSCAGIPIVLHCASLSIGGSVRCPDETIMDIGNWLHRTKSPWLGEHLAFITAAREPVGEMLPRGIPVEPYDIGYTVSPPMNRHTLKRAVNNFESYSQQLNARLLLENSPLYFQISSSTMSQSEFVSELCHLSDVDLLLDLAHLYISARNIGFDPMKELESFPLEKVLEIHISGVDIQPDGLWDDHANPAPDILFEMLERVMQDGRTRAVTLEYNWASNFPLALLSEQLEKVRETLARVPKAA
jgi:uncharacterized protein (UPF0276 family)